MKKCIMLCVFFSLTVVCLSQPDFRSGFIITNSGDTLNGLLNYRAGSRGYKTLLYKQKSRQKQTIYKPGDISGFGFPGDRVFISKNLNPENDSIFFLEVLVRGELTLYSHYGDLYIQKDETLYKLDITRTEIVKDGEKSIVLTKKYLGILSLVMAGCEAVKPEIQSVLLNEKSISALVQHYNSCIGSPYTAFRNNVPVLKISADLSAGYLLSSLDIFSRIRSDQQSLVDFPYEKSNSVVGGFSLNIVFPRFSERLSLYTGIDYFKSNFYSSSTIIYPLAEVKHNVTIDLEQVSIPVGIRYTFFVNRLSPYLNSGFLTTVNLNSDNNWNSETTYLFEHQFTVNDSGQAFKIQNQYGFWAGAGLIIPVTKRIAAFMDLRSEFTYGLSPMPDVSKINNLRVSFGLNLR